MELDEYGLKAWKHKTNKRLFLIQDFRWVDLVSLIDETEGREYIMSFVASTFDYNAWLPITNDEFSKVKSKFRDIYE